MDLRTIKREIETLPDIPHTLAKFQQSWVQPFRATANRHAPFLQNLPPEVKKNLASQVAAVQQILLRAEEGILLQEKLRRAAKNLIELKLSQLQGNTKKTKVLSQRIVRDEFYSIPRLLNDTQNFENTLKTLQNHYFDINQFLDKHLSLEEMISFYSLPHRLHLSTLIQTSRKQREITHRLGKHFLLSVKK